MVSNLERYKKDLGNLIKKGYFLEISMRKECNGTDDFLGISMQKERDTQGIDDSIKKHKEDFPTDLPNFRAEYQTWYSESLTVIEQLMSNRTNDFIKLYERPKNRKTINLENYTIEDYVRGIYTFQTPLKTAILIFQQQRAILESAQQRFESSLFDIKQLLQADLFDSELSAAKELNKKGFIRGAGAIAGVVLESHLKQVCNNHQIKIIKKNPTISYLNDLLKKENIIDTPKHRNIQLLNDWRNLCDHDKEAKPIKEDITRLIKGVNEVIKNIF